MNLVSFIPLLLGLIVSLGLIKNARKDKAKAQLVKRIKDKNDLLAGEITRVRTLAVELEEQATLENKKTKWELFLAFRDLYRALDCTTAFSDNKYKLVVYSGNYGFPISCDPAACETTLDEGFRLVASAEKVLQNFPISNT